jgi:hypothetical protein
MMKDETEDDRYLWDRSGPPDAEVARLEALLSPLGHRGQPPVVPPVRRSIFSRTRAFGMPALSAAAAVLVIAVSGWFALGMHHRGWTVHNMAGAPVVGGVVLSDGSSGGARLDVGAWLVTDARSRARIAVGQIGRVDVDPNTRVQLIEAKDREHRMSLARGTIHAQISAPPKFFYVNTPSAVAIDLGCAYTLQVDDDGTGLLRVTSGWVEFESGGRQSFVPEGAMCATRPGVGPGTPRYDDAPSGYGEALATLDFGRADDPKRAAAFELILSSARGRDALTLWHLLTRGTAGERAQVYDRMAALVPPPRGVTRAAVLRGERPALDQWWDSLGVESTSWWRLWKKRW